LAKKCAEKHK